MIVCELLWNNTQKKILVKINQTYFSLTTHSIIIGLRDLLNIKIIRYLATSRLEYAIGFIPQTKPKKINWPDWLDCIIDVYNLDSCRSSYNNRDNNIPLWKNPDRQTDGRVGLVLVKSFFNCYGTLKTLMRSWPNHTIPAKRLLGQPASLEKLDASWQHEHALHSWNIKYS